MKNFIFYLAGAIFLFVSCQSDNLQIEEASILDNDLKVTESVYFSTYKGEIIIDENTGDFMQTGGGIASPIGHYTFVNNSHVSDFSVYFDGVMTVANGDQIFYNTPFIQCRDGSLFYCPGVEAIFTYIIDGGTGRFEGATGILTFQGTFVEGGPFSGIGSGTITY